MDLVNKLNTIFQTNGHIITNAEFKLVLSYVFSNSEKVEAAREVVGAYDPEAYEEFDHRSSKITFYMDKIIKNYSWITVFVLLGLFWNLVFFVIDK